VETLFDQNLKEGAVFRLHVPHTSPPKIKIFVVIGIIRSINSLAFLFINSEINPNVIKSQHLQGLQFPMAASGRAYIESDSYLDCSRLYEWSIESLKGNYISNTGIYLGQLSDVDLAKVKQLATSARTIERRLKRRYELLN
jgi:hypothetical protein